MFVFSSSFLSASSLLSSVCSFSHIWSARGFAIALWAILRRRPLLATRSICRSVHTVCHGCLNTCTRKRTRTRANTRKCNLSLLAIYRIWAISRHRIIHLESARNIYRWDKHTRTCTRTCTPSIYYSVMLHICNLSISPNTSIWQMIDSGMVENVPAPKIAIDYWVCVARLLLEWAQQVWVYFFNEINRFTSVNLNHMRLVVCLHLLAMFVHISLARMRIILSHSVLFFFFFFRNWLPMLACVRWYWRYALMRYLF